jgi:hypothetical protein
MQEKGRKERSDKKVRVNTSLNQDSHHKLERLAFAVGMPKTVLGAEFIELCLNNPNIIEYIQKIYKPSEDRRVIPIIENWKVTYSSPLS